MVKVQENVIKLGFKAIPFKHGGGGQNNFLTSPPPPPTFLNVIAFIILIAITLVLVLSYTMHWQAKFFNNLNCVPSVTSSLELLVDL